MTKSISFTKKILVDKNKRRKSLIQSEEIDEEKHAVFSYHINNMKKFVHWLNKNVEVVEFMLFQLRKKNIELNNEYNKLIKKKARFEIEYQEWKNELMNLKKRRIWKS